jgi:mannose-6-phosphate isomerase-like protein (cupin superfamily)
MEIAMSAQAKVLLLSVLSYSVVFVLVLSIRPAAAQNPTSSELKSRIIRWDDANSYNADWGEMRRYFHGQTFATEKTFVAAAIVQPGKSVHKAHRHAEEEYLAVVEGTGTWWLDGKQFAARRGDILYVGPWVYHGLTNTGDKPLVFLVIKYNGKGVKPPARPDDRPDELAVQFDSDRGEKPQPAKVSGTVTFNGEPLSNAVLTFVSRKGLAATGVTDKQGRYVLTTFEENDGAVPGQYRVTIATRSAPSSKRTRDASATIPAKYSNPQTSELECEVREGVNQFDIVLSD